MNIITEVIQTPITHECDVLVAGGGVAGIATAVSQEGIRRGCKKATEKSCVYAGYHCNHSTNQDDQKNCERVYHEYVRRQKSI